jgi:cell division protein FtsZ
MNTDLEFGIEHDSNPIIKVIGVGGGGGNAVNQMYNMGIKDVEFVICNTDEQALRNSPVPIKIQLGTTLTEGRGAGNNPAKGREAAIENLSEIEEMLDNNTKMVFITAGMGGGTGTGAAPVIAKAANEREILTVAIVSIPFKVEGPTRIEQAIAGIKELDQYVDSLLIINNERLQDIYTDLKMSNAFSKADDVLAISAKGIAEIITVPGYINVDFEDVRTVMKNSGAALMGSASAEGENRAIDAIKSALDSPLLKDNDIKGAKNILLNIMSGTGESEITMKEFGLITDFLSKGVGTSSNIIWGTGFDEKLGATIRVTVIATGFQSIPGLYESDRKRVIHVPFGDDLPKEDNTEVLEKEDDNEFEEEKQRTFEFDMEDNDFVDSEEDLDDITFSNDNKEQNDSFEQFKDLNKLNDSNFLDDIENEPAYERKKRMGTLDFDFENDPDKE